MPHLIPALLLALLLAVGGAIGHADDGDADDADDAEASPEDDGDSAPVSHRALMTRADVADYEEDWDAATEARAAAIERIDELFAVCERYVATTDERAAAEDRSADEALFAEHWRALVDDSAWQLTRDRAECERWLAETQQDDGGHMSWLTSSRRIVWSREAELFDERRECAEQEADADFDDAHPHRRRVAIVARANRRFYGEKIEGLESNLRLVERRRLTRETDAPDRIRAQIAYFDDVLADAVGVVEHYTQWRDQTSDPAWNAGRARFWGLLEGLAETYGIELNDGLRASAASQPALCRGRAEYYEERARAATAREAERDAEQDGEDSDSNDDG